MSPPPYAVGTRVCATFCPDGELSKHLISLVGLSAFTLNPSLQKGISKDLFFPWALIHAAKGSLLFLQPAWQGCPFLLCWGLTVASSFSFFILSLCTCSVSLLASPVVEFISRTFIPSCYLTFILLSERTDAAFQQHHHDFEH